MTQGSLLQTSEFILARVSRNEYIKGTKSSQKLWEDQGTRLECYSARNNAARKGPYLNMEPV